MPTSSQSLALPARMSLAPTGFQNLNVAVLSFPFTSEVNAFCKTMQDVLRLEQPLRPPYRQFNNALLACAPTLTHGFEYYYDPSIGSSFRALAVGTPNNPLHLPTIAQTHTLIKVWAAEWTRQYRGRQRREADSACDRLLTDVATMPTDWDWKRVDPQHLINDLNAEHGIGYAAIPSLLATLLHNTVCTIRGGHGDQQIIWRKVVGRTSNSPGLFLVSRPFYAWYTEEDGKKKDGYFAYRLDFHVQTQAGRFTERGTLKPWVFTNLSCQRYAHEALKKSNYGRDVSVLMGMNTVRLAGFEADSTLVRLVFENGSDDSAGTWKDQLPQYLEAFKARQLVAPSEIKQRPSEYGNLHNEPSWPDDEYYIVHAEGYKYSDEHATRGHDHAVKTGYALDEYGDVIAQVVEQLVDVLIPDGPLICDIPTTSGPKKPLAMRDYTYLLDHPTSHQQLVTEALTRVHNGESVHVFIIWRDRDTRDAIYRQVQKVLGCSDHETTPIVVSDIYIDEPDLLALLDPEGIPFKPRKAFEEQMRKQHVIKREAWRTFLRRSLPRTKDRRFAIIEIGKTMQSGVHPKQSIHGPIRDACALEGISSQMLQPVVPKAVDQDKGTENSEIEYRPKDKGRLQNGVLDALFRQAGVLLGRPTTIYQQAGLPTVIADGMDVITFYRRRTTTALGDVHFALAVRLSAEGAVDVLLPVPNQSDWIPYAAAGPEIGKLFSHARKDQWYKGKRINSQIKLSGIALMAFVERVMMQMTRRPTLFVIEADGWRNERGEDGKMWPQLKNEYLHAQRDVLVWSHRGAPVVYQRDDARVKDILGVIRVRTGLETPTYISNRSAWTEDHPTRDFTRLSGFYDQSVPDLLHYFSVGRLPRTQKTQDRRETRHLYKLDRVTGKGSFSNASGMDIAFKHQQLVEFVPFFVRPDLRALDGNLALCRSLHYLRTSPAWTMGNISLPYPLHLGDKLIEDQLCILGFDD